MQELDDSTLLQEYVAHESEAAFAALVARHVNKVYSIALRHTRNPHHAEEITQAVFVVLARQAGKLGRRVILSGWLCRTAQLTALTFIRSETRRARREAEAFMEHPLHETETEVWPQIAPLLDAAMAGLSAADYHAVVLRFFDGKSMKEVGAALGASEAAAKMRVNRAVEKLRRFLARRGIVVPAAVLAATLTASSVQAAPATLAKLATTMALAQGPTAATSTTLIQGVLKIMAYTKLKMAIAAGVAVLLVTGTTAIVVEKISRPHPAATGPVTVQSSTSPGEANADHSYGPPGPRHLTSRPDPNARFANLTPEQRVHEARQHYPESVADLQKLTATPHQP